MHAVVHESYGPPEEVLELSHVEPPRPGAGEVLMRVGAAAVAGDDWHLIRGEPWVARLSTGLRRPKHRILPRDVAGEVVAVGEAVTGFAPGDPVFGCRGALAEFAAVPARYLARAPANVSVEEAASVPVSALTALQALRGIEAEEHVLVIGASGGVGSFAVQIAKAMGAEVTGVCGPASRSAVEALGADRILDHTREDFADGGVRYDRIVDLVGDRPLRDLRRALTRGGTAVIVGGTGGRLLKGADRWLRAAVMSPFVSQRLRPLVHTDSADDLEQIRAMIEAGDLTPVVSAVYPPEAVAEAIAHFRPGHARGKVVLSFAA